MKHGIRLSKRRLKAINRRKKNRELKLKKRTLWYKIKKYSGCLSIVILLIIFFIILCAFICAFAYLAYATLVYYSQSK